ncbi:TcfC E-set like domain-containing protein [Cysteiniphilum sp. 19S12-1]|uniref:TcfC E-set like domain-containing protein n=1 Tax=Cysteiniphilum sp. 19S12-1 TaxID=3453130 RepID=UPI003F871177
MVFQHKKSVMYLLAALQGGFAFAEIRAIEDESIPKGFENYQAISTMNVPVYINGRIVATTMVKFDDATIEIINPVSVINRVPTLSDANKQKVLEVLSQKLPNHSERLCKLDAPKSVGYGNICEALTPEIAGVIFNPSNLNLYVFINPKFLESTNGPINPMLASSTSSFSYFNNSSLLYSTTDFNDSSLNLNTNQYFNYGNASLLVTPALEQKVSQRSDNDTTLSINNLTLRYYWNPALISAGTTITAGDNILAQQNIIGMSMRNNNEVYSYSTSNSGTPVEVLLTTNSQVRVYKDNQLIYAQQLPAGKQKLDTYSFPDGSYNITIEVIDQFNKKTVSREFFTKFSLIPEVDKPNYQFALGYLQKTINSNEHFYYPQSYTDEPVFNAKWTQSLNNRLALTGNMLSNFDDIYATFGLDSLLGGNLRLSWYNTVSNVNKYASAITGSWNFGNISWYSNILGVIDNNDALMPKPRLFNPLPSGQQLQLQNNLSFTWLGVSTSLSHSWNTITHQNRYGVSLSRNLFSTSGLSADMTFSAVKTDHDHLIQAGIRFYFTQGRWNVSASSDYMDDGQTQGKFNQSASVYYSHYSSPNAYLSSNATLNYSEDNSSGFVSINSANKLAQYNVQSNITKDTTQVSAMVNSSI